MALFPLVKFVALAFVALIIGGVEGDFIHPGVFLDAERIASIQHQVLDVQSGPVYDAFQKALSSRYGTAHSLNGPPASGVIECGSYSQYVMGDSWLSSSNLVDYVLWFVVCVEFVSTQPWTCRALSHNNDESTVVVVAALYFGFAFMSVPTSVAATRRTTLYLRTSWRSCGRFAVMQSM